MSEAETSKPLCKYGRECYRKNAEHVENFRHPAPKRRTPVLFSPQKKKAAVEPSEDEDEFSEIIKNLTTDRDKIKKLFLVDMPEDFYSFYEFCCSLDKVNPKTVLKFAGLDLAGPFDVLTKDFNPSTQEEALNHCRYFYDPPEFQTLFKGDSKTQFHIGYFRDDPKQLPSFVASNEASTDSTIKPLADNIFGAIKLYLEKLLSKSNPFSKVKYQKLIKLLLKWAMSNSIEIDSPKSKIKERTGKVVAKTFHSAGLVVPYDSKTDLGYRPLIEDYPTIKKMIKNIVEAKTDEERQACWGKLNPVITFANIAADECDFGTVLELGINLFCSGSEIFHRSAVQLMTTAYSLLQREEFSKIIECHLKDRKKIIQ